MALNGLICAEVLLRNYPLTPFTHMIPWWQQEEDPATITLMHGGVPKCGHV